MIPTFASAPLLPALLTCAAAWAIAVWALHQPDPVTRLVQAVTGGGEPPDTERGQTNPNNDVHTRNKI